MAVWETTVPLSAIWNDGTFGGSAAGGAVKKITDDKPGEDTFEVNEAITVHIGSQQLPATFLGTLTVNGVVYPVIRIGSPGTISIGNSSLTFAVGLPPNTANIPLKIASAINSDSMAGKFTVCFFLGTLIATPSGERRVEELVSGDLVLSKDSSDVVGRKLAHAVPVKWIGRQTVSTLFGPVDRLMPVRFAAGSLGGGGAFCRIAT